MAKVQGKDLAVYVDDVKVGDSKTCTLNVSQAFADASSKDSANWKKILPDMREWSVTTDFLHDLTNTLDGYDLVDLILNATQVDIVFNIGSEAFYFYGEAYASATSISGNMGEVVSGNITFNGDGPLSKATIAFS